MRIKSVRIENYKSYENSQISFSSMFNVVVGQNNSGKTALLEAMDLANFVAHPHKRMENGKPARQNNRSKVGVEVALSGDEIKTLFLSNGGTFSIPISSDTSLQVASRDVELFFAQKEMIVPFSYEPHGTGWLFEGQSAQPNSATIEIDKNKESWTVQGIGNGPSFSSEPIREQFIRSIYFSRAERFSVSQSVQSEQRKSTKFARRKFADRCSPFTT